MANEPNLAVLFRNRATTYGDAPRWRQRATPTQPARQATWKENRALVYRLLTGLDALGARPGDSIAILSNTRWEWLVADWAILCLGGITVTVYPSNVAATVAFILNDSGARFVIAEDREQYEKLCSIREDIPAVARVILFEGADAITDNGEWSMSLDALLALGARSDKEADAFAAKRAREILPEDRTTIVYTSGTTGMPKGVVHTHASTVAQLACAREMFDAVQPGMINLTFLPLAHVYGRAEAFMAYDRGVVTVVAPSLDHLIEDMAAARPDYFFSVPRVYEKAYASVLAKVEHGSAAQRRIFAWASQVGREVVRRQQNKQPIPSSLALQYRLADRLVFQKIRAVLGGNLKFAVTGGAPLDPQILEFFWAAGVKLLEGWGLTETNAGYTLNTLSCCRLGTVGHVFPGQELRLDDDGEVLIRGSVVFKGYHNNPQASVEALDPDGWFHTGDIGTLDDDGYLRIVDRKKDLIITAAGKNIAPQLVENTLKTVPCVSQVAVYGDRKPYLVALLTLDPDAVRAWAAEHGVGYSDISDVYSNDRFRAYLDEHVQAANGHLARYETVKYYDVLPDDFTVENECLTPSLKVRRRVVHTRYRDRYEALYATVPAQVAQPS